MHMVDDIFPDRQCSTRRHDIRVRSRWVLEIQRSVKICASRSGGFSIFVISEEQTEEQLGVSEKI